MNTWLSATKKTLQMIHQAQPYCIMCAIGNGFLASILPFINIIGSSLLVEELLSTRDITKISIICGSMLVSDLCIMCIQKFLERKLEVYKEALTLQVDMNVSDKAMQINFELMEHPVTLERIKMAKDGENGSGGLFTFVRLFQSAIQSFFSIVEAIFIVLPLFFYKGNPQTAFEAYFDTALVPLSMLALLLFMLFLHMKMLKKQNELELLFFQENVKYNRMYEYYSQLCCSDYSIGKDIRLYGMQDMIYHSLDNMNTTITKKYINFFSKNGKIKANQAILSQLCNGAIYVFVVAKVVIGAISVASLVRYAGAIAQLSTAMLTFLRMFMALQLRANYLQLYSDFLAIEVPNDDGCEVDMSEFEIAFHDVSFKYPNSEQDSLKHVSMKLHKGEKLAVVGKNGAGKTTFIKLICRMYKPSSGYITLNGIDINDYSYQEYAQQLSVVFQDFHLFSFPLGQNIAISQDIQEEGVWKVLEDVGMKNRVMKMVDHLNSTLFNNGEEGIEISGGEAQKLAIARALYKNAPFVILDEPTAALDPISEYEIYKRFYELAENRTSIFISHRMSSCRFCERILVFDKGQIVEEGSHEQLKEHHGMYASMWNAQAQHYVEGETTFS